jgi:hypothetical protein
MALATCISSFAFIVPSSGSDAQAAGALQWRASDPASY